jgi:hypothetical protein
MCKDYDLFGDVIVTLDDVELWLDKVPRHLSNSPNARSRYAKNYDIASKIKQAKINGSFYQLSGDFNDYSDDENTTKFLYHPDYCAPYREKSQLHRLAHLIGDVT